MRAPKYSGDMRLNKRNAISNLRRAILHYSFMRWRKINGNSTLSLASDTQLVRNFSG